MSAVHSARWYRVAELKPRLTARLQLRRQWLRGATWYLLAEPGGRRHVRLNAQAWAIAGRLDGRHSVQQLWDARLASGEDPPTQDEVIELLAQLREAALVQFDRAADAERLLPHLDSLAHPKQRSRLLAWRLRLADPSALLDRLAPLGRWLFSPTAAVTWALAVLALLLLAVDNASTLANHARQWLATPRYAMLA
ncbi:MAG: PqqD family protein, partial [Burkholderiaceae bacterium]